MKEKGSRDHNPKPNRLKYTLKKSKELFTLNLSDSFNIIHKIKHSRFLVYSASGETVRLHGIRRTIWAPVPSCVCSSVVLRT